MKLSGFAVHRPVFTVMVTMIVVILGMVSLSRLPIDLMPDITYPTVSVSTTYENASPEEIEELITRPIEEAMSAVPGVEEVTSTSVEGSSSIRVSFAWGTDLDPATSDIRDRLDRVIPRLPEEADRPVLRKFDMASFPVLMLGASSDMDQLTLRRIIEDQVKYRIERVPGVAALDIWGGLEREIHVSMDLDRTRALALPLDHVINQLRAANITLPAGTIERAGSDITIRTLGEFRNLHELSETIVAVRDGVPVRLRDIADVEDSWRRVTRIARINGKPGIRLAVNKQSGMNTVDVATKVLREIDRINSDMPHLELTPIIDTSDYIKRSITNVGSTALYGGIFAILILLFFLRNLRSTAIIATAIPISIIATFMLVYFGGFTLNIMTLGGLALGIGMLVDNSIVVLENIYRRREEKADPITAAVEGSAEVTSAIVASTLTTVVVFLPLVFVRGMAGIMFQQLAYVIAFSLACSMFVALTLVPMLASRFLKIDADDEAGRGPMKRLAARSGRIFESIELRYKKLLHRSLAHPRVIAAAAALALAGSFLLVPLLGVELMPSSDESEVRISAEMAVGTNIKLLEEKFLEAEKIIEDEVKEIKSMVTSIGGSPWGSGGSHVGNARIALVPKSQRKRSSEEVAAAIRRRLSRIPGIIMRTRAGQGFLMMRMGSDSDSRLQIEIRGYDLDIADTIAAQIKSLVESINGVTDAEVSRETGTPEEIVSIDRQKAADLGLSTRQVAEMLQTAIAGNRAGYFREAGKEYSILVKIKDAEQRRLDEILDMTVSNSAGEPVVLRNVVNIRPRTGPVLIERKDQERIVTVSGNISGRDLGSVLKDLRPRLRTIAIPDNFSIAIGGDYEEQQEAFRELVLGFILALVLVYMVMASLYESLRDPFVVMFAVPFAAIGVILMLFLTGTTFNIQSFIGCIMLGGIVVNNAILLVDHTNLLRRRDGMQLFEAIEEAGRRRLRPILMTAMTTICALIPMSLGLGEGGEAQAPLARAVIGGLLSSMLITLVVVPVAYSVFEKRRGGHVMAATTVNEEETVS